MRLSEEELARRFKTAKILIAEDDEFVRVMIGSVLSANGLNNLIFATNGYKALQKLESESPDLVILGVMLKVLDGLDLCAQVRRNPKFNTLPILVGTAITNTEERLAAFEVGATDLINKPINPRELIARIRLHLENRFLMSDLAQYRERVQDEFTQAKQMHDMILPKRSIVKSLEEKYNISISTYFESCEIMGGDFWGVRAITEDLMGFYIIDCTGHGITAALNTFRMHAIIKDLDDDTIDLDAASYLSRLNKKLCKLFLPSQFATMFYGIMDFRNDEIYYSRAASTSPILLEAGGSITELSGQGFLLGTRANADFTNQKCSFKKGDKIILYSDAVIENLNSVGEMYGEKRLYEFLSENSDAKEGKSLLARIINEFNMYSRDKLLDDLTVNIYSRL